MNTSLRYLVARNSKVYFKDKAMFFSSLLSPLILLVLFVTFLGGVYEDSFNSFIPQGITIKDEIVTSFTISWLMSSLLGVSCVTVAFCSNIIMAEDKINGARHDFIVSPVKRSTFALAYYLSNVLTTTIVCGVVMILGFAYIATVGWFFSVADILIIILDMLLYILFGTALAAFIDNFIKTQGGIGAVSTLVSALYGFLCGAYMPISQFGEPIRNFVSMLPGTYGVTLLRSHYMNGVLSELSGTLPSELINGIKDGFDVNVYFFGNKMEQWHMYVILGVSIVVILAAYVFANIIQGRKKKT